MGVKRVGGARVTRGALRRPRPRGRSRIVPIGPVRDNSNALTRAQSRCKARMPDGAWRRAEDAHLPRGVGERGVPLDRLRSRARDRRPACSGDAEIAPRSRADRAEIAPRSRTDRSEIAPRSRGDRAWHGGLDAVAVVVVGEVRVEDGAEVARLLVLRSVEREPDPGTRRS